MRPILLAASLALSPIAAPAGTTGTLTGVVRDAQTGAPIANAMVRAFSGAQVESTRTDARGTFTFASLVPGDYDIAEQSEGYWSASERTIVHADTSRNLALTLLTISEAVMAPGRDILVTSRSAGNLVRPGTVSIIDDRTGWPTEPVAAGFTRYAYYGFDDYTAPWANGYFIQMTPGITFGAGVTVTR